jgi:hypothetical protein
LSFHLGICTRSALRALVISVSRSSSFSPGASAKIGCMLDVVDTELDDSSFRLPYSASIFLSMVQPPEEVVVVAFRIIRAAVGLGTETESSCGRCELVEEILAAN